MMLGVTLIAETIILDTLEVIQIQETIILQEEVIAQIQGVVNPLKSQVLQLEEMEIIEVVKAEVQEPEFLLLQEVEIKIKYESNLKGLRNEVFFFENSPTFEKTKFITAYQLHFQ